jgi:hypothetical protein
VVLIIGPPGSIWTAAERCRRCRTVLELELEDDGGTTDAAVTGAVLVARAPPQPAAINPAATATATGRAIRNMPDAW